MSVIGTNCIETRTLEKLKTCIYKQSFETKLLFFFYTQVSKYSLEACDLLPSKLRELPTDAFFQSPNSGESVPIRKSGPKGQVEF